MKLFVWDGVLSDYTDGIIIAYAETIEGARRLVLDTYLKKEGYESLSVKSAITYYEPTIYDNESTARIIFGGG